MKRLWSLLLASTIGLVILCGLGTWQIFRLAGKTKLIAQLEARMDAAPISLEDALQSQSEGRDLEYVKVTTQGQIDWSHALNKITSFDGKPAWEIIAPFTSTNGTFVLIDAGVSPDKMSSTTQGAETIVGIIRTHAQGRGYFDNDNDASGNTWYWWDIPEMLATVPVAQNAKVATFILQKLPNEATTVPPWPQKPKVELHNNHLGYAITWFGLAAALLAVSGFLARSLVKKTDA